MASLVDSTPDTEWHAVRGAGAPGQPVERLSLLAEVFIEHGRFDRAASLARDAGLMVDRHVWPDRRIDLPPAVTRDGEGEDVTPRGAFLSLAVRPRGEDGLGGELAGADGEDARTPHQRDWDFLDKHVRAAYALYRGRWAGAWGDAGGLSDWQRVEALAQYAIQWKMRSSSVYPSFHPVDVLLHSSYCTGAANILHALAMVAGFESRFVAIACHSTVEIHVNGRWVWADNIIPDGGVTPTMYDYAEITEDPERIPCLTPAQRKLYARPVATYRSPYHLGGRCYWHFCWGESGGRADRDDVADGYGLTVPYDPSTATALYPGKRRHVFHVPAGWPPVIDLCEKGAFVRAAFGLEPGRSMRKRFHVSECADNRIRGGVALVRLADADDAASLRASVDGHPLDAGRPRRRLGEPAVAFTIPAALLTPGEHDLVLSAEDAPATLVLYPDPVLPYAPPLSDAEQTVSDASFSVDPLRGADEVDRLCAEEPSPV